MMSVQTKSLHVMLCVRVRSQLRVQYCEYDVIGSETVNPLVPSSLSLHSSSSQSVSGWSDPGAAHRIRLISRGSAAHGLCRGRLLSRGQSGQHRHTSHAIQQAYKMNTICLMVKPVDSSALKQNFREYLIYIFIKS